MPCYSLTLSKHRCTQTLAPAAASHGSDKDFEHWAWTRLVIVTQPLSKAVARALLKLNCCFGSPFSEVRKEWCPAAL